eukprot:26143-Pelagomonas_calceolata.AAC.6
MNARDEETSFRIFSTLNSRGMDLTMVDKLKADLLQACCADVPAGSRSATRACINKRAGLLCACGVVESRGLPRA